MVLEILAHTPRWVFALFAVLVWLGCNQLFARRVRLKRVTVMPIAMTVLSFYGVISAFGDSPMALTCWIAAAAVSVFVVLQRPLHAATHYNASTRTFDLAGSTVPLMLMMGIFFTKYAVGVLLAMHPELAHQPTLELPVSLLYGAFSGIFAARAMRLYKLALHTGRLPNPSQPAL